MSGLTLAIAGTGNLGDAAARALLSPTYYPSRISKVVMLTRDPNQESVKALVTLGATATAVQGGVNASHLQGVDVLLNALGPAASTEIKMQYAKAAADARVKVYFPCAFGADARVHVFDHEMFKDYEAHLKYANSLNDGALKVIAVYNALFLEYSLVPTWGFDTKGKLYQPFGSPDAPMTWTSLGDVGRTVAELAIKAFADPDSVPNELRISGDVKSYREVAEIVGRHTGETIELKGLDWETKRAEVDAVAHGQGHFYEYIMLLVASGKLDYGQKNDNELVNPNQTNWKWKTVDDHVKETNGLK